MMRASTRKLALVVVLVFAVPVGLFLLALVNLGIFAERLDDKLSGVLIGFKRRINGLPADVWDDP